ncbi:hypothetical protein [Desulfovulcanus sp.]
MTEEKCLDVLRGELDFWLFLICVEGGMLLFFGGRRRTVIRATKVNPARKTSEKVLKLINVFFWRDDFFLDDLAGIF